MSLSDCTWSDHHKWCRDACLSLTARGPITSPSVRVAADGVSSSLSVALSWPSVDHIVYCVSTCPPSRRAQAAVTGGTDGVVYTSRSVSHRPEAGSLPSRCWQVPSVVRALFLELRRPPGLQTLSLWVSGRQGVGRGVDTSSVFMTCPQCVLKNLETMARRCGCRVRGGQAPAAWDQGSAATVCHPESEVGAHGSQSGWVEARAQRRARVSSLSLHG